MSDFTLIDLGSQSREVALHINGWPKQNALDWLRQFGEVKTGHPSNPDVYLFHSYAGITTGFIYGDDKQLVIIGDHTTQVIGN